MSVRVVTEVAAKKAFASAIDWPGWSRSGRAEDEALAALLAYGPRYAAVARRARLAFKAPATVGGLTIVERSRGGGGTEFGVPSATAAAETEPMGAADLKRMIALLEASWANLDAAVSRAKGASLRLGPRGGGRQVPKMVEHVREADAAYLYQLGSKGPGSRASSAALRRAFVDALTTLALGEPLEEPNRVRKPWSPRYAMRRSAWHALDHAWEIEDRSEDSRH